MSVIPEASPPPPAAPAPRTSAPALPAAEVAQLERWLAELDERNADNVARTASYLELYAFTVANPPELPWLLMAHLVSRNAGYLMTDVARNLDGGPGARPSPFAPGALRELFLFLERANYLIFYDAWHHVALHLLGRSSQLAAGRTPAFVRDAWRRYELVAARGVDAPLERALVMDLVTNEQNYIERRVVHHARFAAPRALVGFFEAARREAPIALPHTDAQITVGGFARLDRRIEAGRRIFDEVLADRPRRAQIAAWALANPHTGDRSVAGGRPGQTLRAAWPVARVRGLWEGIHAPPEPDPLYP